MLCEARRTAGGAWPVPSRPEPVRSRGAPNRQIGAPAAPSSGRLPQNRASGGGGSNAIAGSFGGGGRQVAGQRECRPVDVRRVVPQSGGWTPTRHTWI